MVRVCTAYECPRKSGSTKVASMVSMPGMTTRSSPILPQVGARAACVTHTAPVARGGRERHAAQPGVEQRRDVALEDRCIDVDGHRVLVRHWRAFEPVLLGPLAVVAEHENALPQVGK
jgi:hypothetical protein